VMVSVYVHSFQSMVVAPKKYCGALSDPPHKGHVAGPVIWLNRLVCLSVCIVSVLYLRTCSCSVRVTFGMDQNVLLSKGLCIRLLVAVCESRAVLHAWAYHAIFARACKAVYLC